MSEFHATTIFAIQHNGKCAMAGDGQVTFGKLSCDETYSKES